MGVENTHAPVRSDSLIVISSFMPSDQAQWWKAKPVKGKETTKELLCG